MDAVITEAGIGDFLADLHLNGNSDATIRAYDGDLRDAARHLAHVGGASTWADAELILARYLAARRNEWSPATLNRRVSAWRSFAKRDGYALLTGYRLPKPPPPTPHPIPEGIEGVKAMIASTKNPQHRAMIALNGLCGLRITEVRAVRPSHFDLDEMMLLVRGKGDKSRRVPVSETAWRAVESRYNACLDNNDVLVPISDRGARKAITRHGRRANLSRPVASHDLRATLGTAFYDKTKDLRATQEALGHADAKTTQRYTQVSVRTLREGMDL